MISSRLCHFLFAATHSHPRYQPLHLRHKILLDRQKDFMTSHSFEHFESVQHYPNLPRQNTTQMASDSSEVIVRNLWGVSKEFWIQQN
jgi:hypothetical protein